MELTEWENLASCLSVAVACIACAMLWPLVIRQRVLKATRTTARWVETNPWLCIATPPLLSLGLSAFLTVLRGIPQPFVHDEASYLLAADTFAHGRLTNPTPEMWEHFETPHQLMRPSYMSKYPPGQAIALATGQILTGQPITGVWLSTALAVMAIHWMLRGLLSPSWALFGAIIAATQTFVLDWSQNYWGGAVAILGSALLLGGWLRLMSSASIPAALGTAAGLIVLANSRPYEGLIFCLVPMLILLTRRHLWSAWLIVPPLLLLMLGAVAMGYYNYRITGQALCMPFAEYSHQYDVYPKFWFLPAKGTSIYRNASQQFVHLVFEETGYAQFKDGYSALVELRNRVALLFITCISFIALLIPLTISLILPGDRRMRWVKTAVLLTVLGLAPETFVQAHYLAPLLPALILLTLLGWRQLHHWTYRKDSVGSIIAISIAAGCLAGSVMMLARPTRKDPLILNQKMVIDSFPQLQSGQHLILVNYCPLRLRTLCDVVHNAADIAGSRIIWARSLQDESNQQLIATYPHRQVWSLNVGGKLTLKKLDPPIVISSSENTSPQAQP